MFDSLWDDLTNNDKDVFQRVARRLLKNTFIVRDKDKDSRNAYFFVIGNYEVMNTYFNFIGFEILIDRENGVVMLKNGTDSSNGPKNQLNRVNLKKNESILLCCLWTLYSNKMSTGQLTKTIMISFTELNLELEKYKVKDQFDRTSIENALILFKRYNLIDMNGKIGDPECLIRLYPSLQFALDQETFKQFVESTVTKMKKGSKNIEDSEEEIEDDE